MPTRRLTQALLCALLCAIGVGPAAPASRASATAPTLRCDGVSVSVPAGWHGRLRSCDRGMWTLTLATFTLVPADNDVGELSSRRMARGDVLIVLIGYGRDQAGNPAFARGVRLPLVVQRMTVSTQFEGMPDGHRLARKTFFARGGAYDAWVQFAGPITRALSSRANRVLRLLRFTTPPKA